MQHREGWMAQSTRSVKQLAVLSTDCEVEAILYEREWFALLETPLRKSRQGKANYRGHLHKLWQQSIQTKQAQGKAAIGQRCRLWAEPQHLPPSFKMVGQIHFENERRWHFAASRAERLGWPSTVSASADIGAMAAGTALEGTVCRRSRWRFCCCPASVVMMASCEVAETTVALSVAPPGCLTKTLCPGDKLRAWAWYLC